LTPSHDQNDQQEDSDVSIVLSNAFREILVELYCEYPALVNFVGWNYVMNNDRERLSNMLIITEFMPGGNIRQYTDVNDTQKVIYLFGSARGLGHLHSKEMVHRDVKLKTIFLDSRCYPRVGDFGFAKLAKSLVVTCRMGSDPYMA
jgi:serine/threonine protein kinase